MNIPTCMSTQHPDNVHLPFFCENSELGGEDEIQEAYYAFSHLGCDEQMWDCEGKEVDNFVVKKLLTKYDSFFREHRLGKEFRMTLRVPNPTVEKDEAKILLETLESIPRSFDAAKLFYQDDTPPVFEVILPMTSSSQDLNRIYRYYSDVVVGKQHTLLGEGDITIADWIGSFKPERINVIPLFESREQILSADAITKAYLNNKDIQHQRVFFARSDPAMNYGLISAVLLNKIAFRRLHELSASTGIQIYPIIGVGSAPFRGNLRPQTVDRVVAEYPSVHTFTVQSAFKYDNPPETVREAIQTLRMRKKRIPPDIDARRCTEIIDKYAIEFQKQIFELAPAINKVAKFVPGRRKRKLHIGLFGYSRNVEGVTLPRAITFTAALYSLGMPPELLGLNALTDDDIRFLKSVYVNFEDDLRDSLRYFNPESGFVPKEISAVLDRLGLSYEADIAHKAITDGIARSVKGSKTEDLSEPLLHAANLRKFLG